MRRARADELREDAVPVMVLSIPEARLRELFPVRFSRMDSFSEAEPSKGALIQLESGAYFVVVFGRVTHRATVSIPRNRNARQELAALLNEVPVRPEEVEWSSEPIRNLVASPVAKKRTFNTLAFLSQKSSDELRQRERDLRDQLFKLRFQRAGRVQNPLKMRRVRHEIAKIQDVLRERRSKSRIS